MKDPAEDHPRGGEIFMNTKMAFRADHGPPNLRYPVGHVPLGAPFVPIAQEIKRIFGEEDLPEGVRSAAVESVLLLVYNQGYYRGVGHEKEKAAAKAKVSEDNAE